MQVVLIWRDHSATVAGGYNASLSREALSKKNKQTVASNMNMRAKGSNKASKNKGGAAGAGAAGEEGHRKGIVMEIAKSDLDTSHLLQYIQVRFLYFILI